LGLFLRQPNAIFLGVRLAHLIFLLNLRVEFLTLELLLVTDVHPPPCLLLDLLVSVELGDLGIEVVLAPSGGAEVGGLLGALHLQVGLQVHLLEGRVRLHAFGLALLL